jgi:hypothetical protein
MNEFLFLFRSAPPAERSSPEEMQRSLQKWGAWIQGLTAQGRFKAGQPLEGAGKVLAGTKKILTDGPYAESKELVGGYVIVTASSLDEATHLAKECPIFADGGSVEVRQIREMSM